MPPQNVTRLAGAHVVTLRRHFPKPSRGAYSICAECGHAWEPGALAGCDDYVRAAEALGLESSEQVQALLVEQLRSGTLT